MLKKYLILSVMFVFVLVIPFLIQGQTAAADPINGQTARLLTEVASERQPLPTDQIIIKFEQTVDVEGLTVSTENGRLDQLSQAAGVDVQYKRTMSGDAHVLVLAEPMPAKEVARIAAKLSGMEGVVYAEPDLIKQTIGRTVGATLMPDAVPNDTRYNEQWHYTYVAGSSEGLNLQPAWDITTGVATINVAVIDTGILPHADLAGKTVSGYDFISDPAVGNDGDGRDADPSDPGDWVTSGECFPGSQAIPSSWHGTHVAGTIGAATNNNLGVAGVNWHAKILPVRVLGKCGGYTSDIVDGMSWSAGLAVSGVPANANPAKVLNLSLGGGGVCSTSEQNAINAIVAAGSVVVIAAGNDNDDASGYSPGNCDNVITVAATDRTGDRASYSNYGTIVELSAPGGETNTLANGVLSTLDGGANDAG